MKTSFKTSAGLRLSFLAVALGSFSTSARSTSIVTGPVALDATSVVTAGTPVTAVKPNTAFNGCYIQNDPSATTNLYIDPVNTANHSSPSSTVSIIIPGGSWNCPYNAQTTVTIDTSDNNHKFYGIKY
jgi:hypothetical protein